MFVCAFASGMCGGVMCGFQFRMIHTWKYWRLDLFHSFFLGSGIGIFTRFEVINVRQWDVFGIFFLSGPIVRHWLRRNYGTK